MKTLSLLTVSACPTRNLAFAGTDPDAGSVAYDGDFSASYGATMPGRYDTVGQTLSTTNGQLYTFSFFLAGGDPANCPLIGGASPGLF